MSMVNFKKGLRAGLPATYSAGTFYVTTDERAMYLDISDSARIRLGDFQEFASVSELEKNSNPSSTALYYVADINCLAKWNGSEYVQINRDTGATNFEVVGEGNAITAVAYDATGRKLTLTKGVTFMTSADVDSKISTAVGTLGNDSEGNAYANVKAYVDAKTAGIATDAALSELQEQVNTNKEDIADLKEATAEGGAVTTAIASAQSAADDAQAAADQAQSEVDALETVVSEYKTSNDAAVKAAADAAAQAQSEVDAVEVRMGTAEGEISTLKTNLANEISRAQEAESTNADNILTNSQAIAAMDTAYKAADASMKSTLEAAIALKADQTALDTVSGDVATIKGDYLKSSDKTELNNAIALKADKSDLDSAVADINTIKGDYLKAADKQALEAADEAIDERVVELESKITGLSGAMHFEGVKNAVPEDVTGYESGDVIIVGDKEYVFNGTEFVEFGDVSAEGERIGDLEDRMNSAEGAISTNSGDIANLKTADTTLQSNIDAEVSRAKAAEEKALTDAKAYADQAELDAVASAKTYTDTTVNTEKERAMAAEKVNADAVVTEKERAMAAEEKALSDAKAYTNEVKSALETAYKAADTETLNAAKSYADEAKASAISTAAADATSKANTAKSEAISEAAADATTKANAAEAAAIAAAKTETTNQVGAAKTELQAYADQAEADAISTAAADATSKANVAVATAATDATNKADAAEAAAKSYADGLLTWGEF